MSRLESANPFFHKKEYQNLQINKETHEKMNKNFNKNKSSAPKGSLMITSKLLGNENFFDETESSSKQKASLDCADITSKSKLSYEMGINSEFGLKASRSEKKQKISQTDKIPMKKPKKEFIEDFILEEEDDNDTGCVAQSLLCNLKLQRTQTEKPKTDLRTRSFSSIISKLHLQYGANEDLD